MRGTGCDVDLFLRRQIWYTWNGRFLGTPPGCGHERLKQSQLAELYPTVGVDTGAAVTARHRGATDKFRGFRGLA